MTLVPEDEVVGLSEEEIEAMGMDLENVGLYAYFDVNYTQQSQRPKARSLWDRPEYGRPRNWFNSSPLPYPQTMGKRVAPRSPFSIGAIAMCGVAYHSSLGWLQLGQHSESRVQ